MSSNPIKKQNSNHIMCSAGRGVMSKAGCLQCARELRNECGFDLALLNALFKDKEREGIHVTDLTGCIRQAYYNKMSAPYEYPHEMLNRFLGTGIHKHIENFPMPETFDSELPLQAMGLVGTADIVYKDGRIIDFKCQPKGELVTMADGTEKRIEDIRIFDQVLSLYDEEFGADTVTAIVDGGVQEVFEIKIASGQTIRASGNHPVLTERGWVNASQLSAKSDLVIVVGNWLSMQFSTPADDARLLGYLIGDGGTSRQYGVNFTNADPEILEDVAAICHAKGWDFNKRSQSYGYDWRISNQGKKLSTTGPIAFLQQYGLHRKYAYDKTVPDPIMAGDFGSVVNFLAGYFDTDGTITDPESRDRIPARLTMTTTSERLAQQVSTLLRRVGISNRIYKHQHKDNRPAYMICVWQADMILKFGHVVPFRNNNKRSRWERWYPHLQATLRKGGKNARRVESVTSLGLMQTIGLEIANTHNYVTGDVVTHNTTRWIKLDKLPYGSHVQQLNIYAALLRAQGREVTSAAIQYIDLSGPSKCTTCKGPTEPGVDGVMKCKRCGKTLATAHPGVALVEVALEDDSVVAEWIQTRLKILEMSIEGRETPDAEPSYLCDYCPFQSKCEQE